MGRCVFLSPRYLVCVANVVVIQLWLQVDAQNKFMGKSFEIRPTGVAHAELLIPEERGPGYPKAPGKAGEGKVVEHYSWKKVTTNVSGFILGHPRLIITGIWSYVSYCSSFLCMR